MKRVADLAYHALSGNDTAPEITEISRGTVTAALTGIANIVLLFMPIPESQKATIMASISPSIVLVAAVLWGYYDRLLRKVTEDAAGAYRDGAADGQ